MNASEHRQSRREVTGSMETSSRLASVFTGAGYVACGSKFLARAREMLAP